MHLTNAPAENAVSTGAFCENPARETGPEKAAGAAKGRLPAAPLQIAVTSRWFAGGSFQRAGFPPPPGKAQKSVRGRRNFLERPRIAKHPPLRASTVRCKTPAPQGKHRAAHARRQSERAGARLCRRIVRAKAAPPKGAKLPDSTLQDKHRAGACPPERTGRGALMSADRPRKGRPTEWQRSIKKYCENTNLCQVNGKYETSM